MEQLLTLAEVAKILRVSHTTLRAWDNQNKLKAIKTIGGHRRYLKSQIEALIHYTIQPEENQDDSSRMDTR
jgi:excisionase family DNA binding protein